MNEQHEQQFWDLVNQFEAAGVKAPIPMLRAFAILGRDQWKEISRNADAIIKVEPTTMGDYAELLKTQPSLHEIMHKLGKKYIRLLMTVTENVDEAAALARVSTATAYRYLSGDHKEHQPLEEPPTK